MVEVGWQGSTARRRGKIAHSPFRWRNTKCRHSCKRAGFILGCGERSRCRKQEIGQAVVLSGHHGRCGLDGRLRKLGGRRGGAEIARETYHALQSDLFYSRNVGIGGGGVWWVLRGRCAALVVRCVLAGCCLWIVLWGGSWVVGARFVLKKSCGISKAQRRRSDPFHCLPI